MLPLLGVGTAAAGGGGGGSGTLVDALIRMENGINGDNMTTAILGNMTNAPVAGWSWTLTPASPTKIKVSTAQEIQIDGLRTSAGGSGDATGTRTTEVDFSSNQQKCMFTFPVAKGIVSCGCALKFVGWDGADFSFYDTLSFEGTAEFGIAALQSFQPVGTSFGIQAHTNDPSLGPLVVIPINSWLWFTMLWDKTNGATGLLTVKIYQLPALTLIGTTTRPFAASTDCQSLTMGRYDANAGTPAAKIYYDDMCIDYNGAFPLLPT